MKSNVKVLFKRFQKEILTLKEWSDELYGLSCVAEDNLEEFSLAELEQATLNVAEFLLHQRDAVRALSVKVSNAEYKRRLRSSKSKA